jgi:hypothetical protein
LVREKKKKFYPQIQGVTMTNGQVECANGMILQGLKPRIYNDLKKFGRRWMKELPSMV